MGHIEDWVGCQHSESIIGVTSSKHLTVDEYVTTTAHNIRPPLLVNTLSKENTALPNKDMIHGLKIKTDTIQPVNMCY